MTVLPGQATPKILEIGQVPYLWQVFPQTTEFYSTWPDETENEPRRGRHVVSAASLLALSKKLADPSFDLIVVQPPVLSPWSSEGISRAVFRRGTLRGNFALFRGFGTELLRRRTAAPVAVLDQEDTATIPRCNGFLLDRATIWFKRELPIDRWQAFAGTMHRRMPTARFRQVPANANRMAKLRPLSLGIPFEVARRISPEIPHQEKSIDVFFSGRIRGSSTVRTRGFEELTALAQEGYAIDVGEGNLPLDEYLARCARAHLVWSPEGYGWQCFRTYEAAMCGAAVVCNRPRIERHHPLIDGVHALYYDVEPGDLSRVVRTALADRERLRRIGAAARQHVLRFHTPTAIAHGVVEATLQAAGRRTAQPADVGVTP